MLKLVTEPVPAVDPLASCVESVLEFHHRRTDLSGLLAELPLRDARLTIAALPALCEKLDCSLRIVKATADEVRGTRTAIILPLQKSGYAVVLPDPAGQVSIRYPGKADEALNESHLASWSTGRVLVMMPRLASSDTQTDHMQTDRPIDWFWKPILKFTPNFAEVVVCTVFINLLVIALPLFTLNVYDSVVPNLAMSTLTVLALGVAIAIAFDVLLKAARTSTLEKVAVKTASEFDSLLMQRLLSVREEHMQLSVGERCNLFRELQGLRDFYATRLVPALVDFPFFLLFLLIIYLISPAVALVPVGIAVAILALNAAVQVPVRRSTEALFSSMQEKSSLMVELLGGSVALRQLNAVGPGLSRWGISAERAAEASRRSQQWISLGQHGSLGLMQLNHVLVVVVGVYQIQAGALTIGGLVASTILASRTIAPIMNLHGVVARWTQSRDCLRTIDELFNRDVDQVHSRVMPENAIRGAIAVDNFTYRYPDQGRNAVSEVNLAIKAGEHVCLIGPSGAGKSTLARAIAGALSIQQGGISIDGFDYKALTAARLRSAVALIPQNPFFVTGTIRENLLLGLGNCSEEKLARASTLAGLDQLLANSGKGLDTEAGESGSALSGGQKQAVSIARAILRDAPVLILDEPTNGLDSSLERHFMRTMKTFTKERTLIMVTHRTSLVSLVERVVVMDNGRVVADGHRDSIMQRFSA